MRDLNIAYGNSRTAKFWSNKVITFDELCSRLEVPVRTPETVEEYKRMKKTEREEIKDKGGFVAGHLRGNIRKIDAVESRSMLVFDLDEVTDGVMEKIEKIQYAACIYSTHSHTPASPRIRILIPSTRDMSVDEFNAVARFFAQDSGFLDAVDVCSFKPNQLMYWPTAPSNGEYVYKRIEGEWLDPDKILSAHANWRDCSLLPTTSKESRAGEYKKAKQKDPLEKNGAVGAFCRCFGIRDVMEEFLSDVYAPSVVEGRYDYIPGEGTAGVVVYDDKFAYSHHATDPACGQLLNSFDLIRVHKFDGDFNATTEFVLSLDKVKVRLAKERQERAEEDFKDNDEWMSGLAYEKGGAVIADTAVNLYKILKNDPGYQGFAYNILSSRIEVIGPLAWSRPAGNKFWRDADTAQLKLDLDSRYGEFSARNHDVAFTKVADDRRFHPIRDYLDSLPEWDGIERLEELYIDYFGAEDTPYIRAVSRKSLIAAVARVYIPGIKFDTVPIINGPQGIGKSTFFSKLAGEWFSDSLTMSDMKERSGAEKLQGYWILELSELSGMRKTDMEIVKSFLTRMDDQYRPPYGRTVESHPRQCIIVGTTNAETGFLRDLTGNRRYWPIKVSGESKKKAWNMTKEEIEQIWAEAKKYFDDGERVTLADDAEEEAENAQRDALEADEREGLVEVYLNTLLPENWDGMDLYQRREYLSGDETCANGTVERKEVSNAEIWAECFKYNIADMKPSDAYVISAIMQKVGGWERSKKSRRLKIYGKQRIYVRKEEKEK